VVLPLGSGDVRREEDWHDGSADVPQPRAAAAVGFDLKVLAKSKWWLTPTGERIALADLDLGDRLDLAEWLRQHSRYFYPLVLRLERPPRAQ
jgi:hypothetical protein